MVASAILSVQLVFICVFLSSTSATASNGDLVATQQIDHWMGAMWLQPQVFEDGSTIACTSTGCIVRIDASTGEVTRLTDATIRACSVVTLDSMIIVGTTSGTIVRVNRNGKWRDGAMVHANDSITAIAISSDTVFCATSSGLIFSSATSSLQCKQVHERQRVQWSTITASRSAIVAAGESGAISVLDRATGRWSDLTLPDSNAIYCGASVDDSCIILAGDRGRAYRTTTAGTTWSDPIQVIPPYPYSNVVGRASPDNILHIARLTDGSLALTGDFYRKQGSSYVGVYMSRDQGASWKHGQYADVISQYFSISGSPITGTVWTDGSRGHSFTTDYSTMSMVVHSTTNGGEAWGVSAIIPIGSRLFRDSVGEVMTCLPFDWKYVVPMSDALIAFRTPAPDVYWGVRDTTDVMRSLDSGVTWTRIARIPDRVRRVLATRSGLLYLGSAGQESVSADQGEHWSTLPRFDTLGDGIDPIGAVVTESGRRILSVQGYHFREAGVPDGAAMLILDPNASNWRFASVSKHASKRVLGGNVVKCGSSIVTVLSELHEANTHWLSTVYQSRNEGEDWERTTANDIETWSYVLLESDEQANLVVVYADSIAPLPTRGLPRCLISTSSGQSWQNAKLYASENEAFDTLGGVLPRHVAITSQGSVLLSTGDQLLYLTIDQTLLQTVHVDYEPFVPRGAFNQPVRVQDRWFVPGAMDCMYAVSPQPTMDVAEQMESVRELLKVTPNPCESGCTVLCTPGETVTLYSLQGIRQYESQVDDEGKCILDLGSLPASVYVLVTSSRRYALINVMR